MEISVEEQQNNWTTLEALINLNDRLQLDSFLEDLSTTDLARAVSRLDKEDQIHLLEIIGYEKSARLISKISDIGVPGIVAQLPQAQAVSIVEEMPSDRQADVMKKLNEDHAESILQDLGDVSAHKIRQLMSYPENTAGGLMITEYLSYTSEHRIKDVLDDLQQHGEQYSDYNIKYAYVVADTDKLVGVLRLRELFMAPIHQRIEEVMVKNPMSVNVHASLSELREFFRQ
mgnify:FL=1